MWHPRTEITHVLAFPRERMIDKGTGRSATREAPLETGPCIQCCFFVVGPCLDSSPFNVSTFFLDVADLGIVRRPERCLGFLSFSSSLSFFAFPCLRQLVLLPHVRNVTTADDRSRNQPDAGNKCRLGFGRGPTAAQDGRAQQ